MATLTNTQIDQTYVGLIKTSDNGVIGATPKALSDGDGNAINMEIGTAQINFPAGTVDFTGATVIGAGGAAGLVSGTGSSSMRSANSLTAAGPQASGPNDICIGNGGIANGNGNSIFIGGNGQASDNSIGIGNAAIAINTSIALHDSARATGSRCVSIGRATDVSGNQAIGISGEGGTVSGAQAVGVGSGCNISGTSAGGFGYQTTANATGAFAIGNAVNAQIAETVSIKELEVQTVGGGITMYSPNGTAYKLTVTDAGALLIS